MRTTPWRRTTLQFLQIFFTDALTFIAPVLILTFTALSGPVVSSCRRPRAPQRIR